MEIDNIYNMDCLEWMKQMEAENEKAMTNKETTHRQRSVGSAERSV